MTSHLEDLLSKTSSLAQIKQSLSTWYMEKYPDRIVIVNIFDEIKQLDFIMKTSRDPFAFYSVEARGVIKFIFIGARRPSI